MKRFAFILLLLLNTSFIYSQQHPSSVKWFEINAEHSKVIFPEGLEKQAFKAASLIDYLYHPETKSLKGKPKKIPLLIYNNSVVSNGFVGLRPYRSAWYTTPSQFASSLGSQDWFYTLSSHEFRHAVQYAKSNKYFTKILSVLFGQTGTLMGQYSYPFWFFEGDAVRMETALSQGGRGRIPQFEMGIRTILLNDKKIKYDKAKFGSYKTFYPNHYNLGWLLTSYAATHYGADVWDRTLETASKFSYWPYAFSVALKRRTGLNEKRLYKKAMQHLDSAWTEKIKDVEFTEIKVLNKAKKKSWTKYAEPNFIHDSLFLVKKSSMKSDLPAFYTINNKGVEQKIKTTDANMVSYAKNKAVWSRTYPDLRWQLRSYSDIIVLDIATKKETRLTKKQKFFAPAISPNGKMIAAIEFNNKANAALVILDAKTGKEIMRYKELENYFPRTPLWDKDSRKIVFTRTNERGNVLSIYDIETKKLTNITETSYENIGRPVFYKNYIIYNSPFNGIGNIYAIDIDSKERFQITSRKFGAYNPKIHKDKMIFTDYTIEGYDLAYITLDEHTWKPLKEVKYLGLNTPATLQKQEQGKNILNPDLIPDKTYEIKKYNKLKYALNIHSWAGYFYPSFYTSSDSIIHLRPKVGLNLYSANVLNTVFGSVGANYDTDKKTFSSDINLIFKRFYPEFEISGTWRQRSETFYNKDSILTSDRWDELIAQFQTGIPFDFSSGVYNRGARINLAYSFTQIIDKEVLNPQGLPTGRLSSLQYSGQIFAFRRKATQDINPKLGYFLYAGYKHIPFSSNAEINSTRFSAIASAYLPGLFRHHSLNIKTGIETQRSQNYYFLNLLSFPRGYAPLAYKEMFLFQANYTFPLWYPDFNIGPFVYFKRLRANAFLDYAKLSKYSTYPSTGLELYLQMYLFRLQMPLEIGGRLSYLLDGSGKIIPEFIALSIPL